MKKEQFQKVLSRCINLHEPYKSQIFPPELHELLSQRTTIDGIFSLPVKGERIFLISLLRDLLTPKEYGRLFVDQWNYSESPAYTFGNKTPILWHGIPKEFLMTSKEMKVYTALPEVVTIYRGVASKESYIKQFIRGFSWTLDKDKAKWFASRYTFTGYEGIFITATIPKEHIAFYCNQRSEKEIVVNPKYLTIKSKESVKKVSNDSKIL